MLLWEVKTQQHLRLPSALLPSVALRQQGQAGTFPEDCREPSSQYDADLPPQASLLSSSEG